jgi:tripartite-type tricarboxylate transporter receptor subunit TctC
VAEEGIAGFRVDLWYGLFAPARTPADALARLNSEVNAILSLESVKATLREQGLTPAGGPAEPLASLVRADLAKWQKAIQDANIKPE